MDIDHTAAAAWAPLQADAFAMLPADRKIWRVSRSGSRCLVAVSSAGVSWGETAATVVTRAAVDVTGVEFVGMNGVVLHATGLLPARLTFPDLRDRDLFEEALRTHREHRAPSTVPMIGLPVTLTAPVAVPAPVLTPASVPAPATVLSAPAEAAQVAVQAAAQAAALAQAQLEAAVRAQQALATQPVAAPVPVARPGASVAQTRMDRALGSRGAVAAVGAAERGIPTPTAYVERPAAPAYVERPAAPARPTPVTARAAVSHAPSTTRLRAARMAEERRLGVEAPVDLEVPSRRHRPQVPAPAEPRSSAPVETGRDGLIGSLFLALVGGLVWFVSNESARQSVHSTSTVVLDVVAVVLVALGVLAAVVSVARMLGAGSRG